MSDIVDAELGAVSDYLPTDNAEIETVPQEPTFTVDGQPIAFSKLDPEKHVKTWYDSHTNAEKWKRENTQKAQELAKQRKEWDSSVNQVKAIEQYLTENPELYQIMVEYGKKKNVPNQTAKPQTDPRVDKMAREWQEYKAQQDAIKAEQEERSILEELKKEDPEFKEEDFYNFKTETMSNLNDRKSLYKLLNQMRYVKNRDVITDAAKKQTINDIKNKKISAVETGRSTSVINIPDNLPADASIEDYFNAIAK